MFTHDGGSIDEKPRLLKKERRNHSLRTSLSPFLPGTLNGISAAQKKAKAGIFANVRSQVKMFESSPDFNKTLLNTASVTKATDN